MKRLFSLLVICIAVLCFFSSCAMEKPLEAKYTLYGSISYTNAKEEEITVPRCQLFLYPNGEYEITLINIGTWKRAEDDSNKVILTASNPEIFSIMELEYDTKWHTLEQINTETTNKGFEIEGIFRFNAPL